MAPTNNFSKQNNVNSNQNRISQQSISKPTNMTTPIPNPNMSIGNGSKDRTHPNLSIGNGSKDRIHPNLSIGNGSKDRTLNTPPANYNRNNSSLRMFSDWLEKAEKNKLTASNSAPIKQPASNSAQIKQPASNSAQIKHTASNSAQIKHTASSSAQMKHIASNSFPVPAIPIPPSIVDSETDIALSKSEVLTREEVLKRRSNRLKSLMKVYKDHYWAMAEELKARHREYYWEYGKSPFQEDEVAGEGVDGNNSVPEENNKPGTGLTVNKCEAHGCKQKAMALTRFCHPHILSDPNQKLYKGCTYVTKSSAAGPMYCMKPVMRSTVPLLCSLHFGKAEKHVAKALRKAGHTSTSKGRGAPKLHLVISELVKHTKAKRRIALVESKK